MTQIRVGRIIYKNGKTIYPSFAGYTDITVLFADHSYWGDLSPYHIGEEGKEGKFSIMENYWQFSKVYPSVPKIVGTFSKNKKDIVWDHPEEVHIDKKGNLTEKYYAWRNKGMYNEYPVRYPVGYKNRGACIYSLYIPFNGNEECKKLNYIDARKQIYVNKYCELVKKHPKFNELLEKIKKGEKLLIIEVDGPHQESLQYYEDEYKVPDHFIENSTIEVNEENMKIMLNDPKHPFGHGYCLAIALLKKEMEWCK